MALVRRALEEASAEFIPCVAMLESIQLMSRCRSLTIIIDEISHCDSEKRTLHACVESLDALTIDNALRRGECPRPSLLSLDLRPGGEGDERVSA